MESQWTLFLEVFIATLLGGAVGLERELAKKPAGLRTMMFVGGAAALFMGLGEIALDRFMEIQGSGPLGADPIRIIQAIVVGISFLGAGTVIQIEREARVEGLTTAATVLFVAAIGVTVALEHIVLGVALAALALVINFGIGLVEHRLLSSKPSEPS